MAGMEVADGTAGGGKGVAVGGGSDVSVGAGGTAVAIGGMGVAVGGTGVAGAGLAVGETGAAVGAAGPQPAIRAISTTRIMVLAKGLRMGSLLIFVNGTHPIDRSDDRSRQKPTAYRPAKKATGITSSP